MQRMFHRVMFGLLLVLGVFAFRPLAHAADRPPSAESQTALQARAGFDNPIQGGFFELISLAMVSYGLGFFILVMRALARRLFPPRAQVTVLNIEGGSQYELRQITR